MGAGYLAISREEKEGRSFMVIDRSPGEGEGFGSFDSATIKKRRGKEERIFPYSLKTRQNPGKGGEASLIGPAREKKKDRLDGQDHRYRREETDVDAGSPTSIREGRGRKDPCSRLSLTRLAEKPRKRGSQAHPPFQQKKTSSNHGSRR